MQSWDRRAQPTVSSFCDNSLIRIVLLVVTVLLTYLLQSSPSSLVRGRKVKDKAFWERNRELRTSKVLSVILEPEADSKSTLTNRARSTSSIYCISRDTDILSLYVKNTVIEIGNYKPIGDNK